MRKRTREILAVVLLGVFAVVGVSAMAWYILVGHNWNVAASNIDDSIGRMEGYSVVLYEGTKPVEPGGAIEAASIADAAASYRDKGATVFCSDTEGLFRYSDPLVVSKGAVKLGMFAAGKADRPSVTRARAGYLSRKKCDYIVALTDDPSLGELSGEGLVGNISIVICNDPKGRGADGKYCGSTYCVNAPRLGEVGAIIISPSGVLSSKVVRLDDQDESATGREAG